ncbi:MAG: hypothetical protein ACLU4B_01750 [Bilophila wadsworthia]
MLLGGMHAGALRGSITAIVVGAPGTVAPPRTCSGPKLTARDNRAR